MLWIDKPVRAVFFDAVGTLLAADPPPARVYVAAAERRGIPLPEPEVRQRLWAAFADEEAADRAAGYRVCEEREERRWRRIVAEALPGLPDPEGCFRELWHYFSLPEAWREHPHAARVLDELARRGLILGIASNFDGRLRSILAGLEPLEAIRERCVISSLVGYRKPARPFFEAVVEAAGCRPEEVLFVGDHPHHDFEGARAAGLRAVLLDPEGRSPMPERIAELGDLLEPALK